MLLSWYIFRMQGYNAIPMHYNSRLMKHWILMYVEIQHFWKVRFTSIFVAGNKHLWHYHHNSTQRTLTIITFATCISMPASHLTLYTPVCFLAAPKDFSSYFAIYPLSHSHTDNFLGPKVGIGGPNIQNYAIKRWAGKSSVTKGKIVPNESKELKTRCRQYPPLAYWDSSFTFSL